MVMERTTLTVVKLRLPHLMLKKNLDYRANTNKILEKKNLTNTLPQQNTSNIIPNNTSYTNYSKRETPLSPTSSNGESFKTMFTSPVSKKRPLDISPNQNSNIIRKNEPPAKQLKSSSGSTIYNSYNMRWLTALQILVSKY